MTRIVMATAYALTVIARTADTRTRLASAMMMMTVVVIRFAGTGAALNREARADMGDEE
jgi:hypothetical protein